MSKHQSHALFALILLVFVWGYSWVVMKQVLDYAGPFEFAALRYLGGAVVLFAIMIASRQSLQPPPLKLALLIGLCQTTGFQAFAQWALVGGGAGNVSLLSYTMPFWVVVFAWWLLAERPNARQWTGVAVAGAGLVCIMRPWRGVGDITSALLALGGGVFWGLGTVLSKRAFQMTKPPTPLSLTAWQMLLGGLGLGIIALAVPARPIEWSGAFIAGLVYSIVLASSLAWLLWGYIIKRLPTTVAGLSSLGVPVVAALLAWAILAEAPGPWETAGIVLILCGLWVVSGARAWPRRRGHAR